MSHSILIVEDDRDLLDYLRNALLEKNYRVSAAGNGMKALKIIEKAAPDMVLLDMGLPDINGEDLCRQIKKLYPQVIIMFLTAQDASPHIVHAFDIGADDYITKPFIIDEVLARIRARLRQDTKITKAVLKIADLTLNTETYEVKRNGTIISLTPKEFKLLEYLMINKNRVLNREQILSRIWEYHYDIESRVVDMYIGMLRKKIDNDHKKKLIQSIRGFGYMLQE